MKPTAHFKRLSIYYLINFEFRCIKPPFISCQNYQNVRKFSRRNLPTEIRLALAYKFKEFEAEKARTRKLSTLQQFSEPEDNIEVFETPDRSPVTYREEESDETNDNEGKTLETVTKKAGVSYGTAFQ